MNHYNVKVSALENKSFTISGEKRKGFENINMVPGPGAYRAKDQIDDIKFSFPKGMRSDFTNR